MTEHYFLDPLDPFPPKWRDKIGPLTVMAGPVKGYVMVRRPGAMPFVLAVSDLCNATQRPPHGPFELVRRSPKEPPPPPDIRGTSFVGGFGRRVKREQAR